jgi:acetyltransferase-like isoleucine patch superfamily enzyme
MVRNILPVFLGFFYFGFYGLSRLVRVYGRLHIRANRKTIILGKKIKIYPGVSFVGNGEADELIQIGNSVVIESNAYLNTHGGKIEIGDGVHIGFGVVLQGKGSVIIGDHSMLGPYVQCYSSNHRQSESFIPRALLGEKKQQIQVGNNSWI